MDKSKTSFRREIIIVLPLLLASYIAFGQGNCLLYPEGSGERKACELSYKAIEHRQGSRESQILFDSAIAVGPNYAWAYYEKSVPYFKRGLFHEGIEILHKAVELEPQNHYMCYRAYWYFSQQSYAECIADLERYYYELYQGMDFTPGGEAEMRLLLGLAYVHTGDLDKGLDIIQTYLDTEGAEDFVGTYDYYILGVLYMRNKQYDLAYKAFDKQVIDNPYFANSYYYQGLIAEDRGDNEAAIKLINMSLDRFKGKNSGYGGNLFGLLLNQQTVEEKLSLYEAHLKIDRP